ncbi:hypothetical protein HYPSUDRAFT_33549 [Hypholoma sublateritium FD-334 SS-4]|uniref:Ribosomal RNA-processing protein 17 n=1 Tax=Hypholoma sublateritium (strain FD-334 SS-4) TaxID=945553 RepID=A0A0D2PDX4_HYPSF|nr:hypothetical protein HYPSUDRAFT_33549 [Hypholoma sublateritium FD-334 SS-4]
MNNNNLARLTRAHTVIAAKRRARSEQVKEVIFDDDARREFLTGFHKRKLAKAEAARAKAKQREKEERQESRREQRRHLREKALENAAHVEKAYGATTDADLEADDSEDDTWAGIQPEDAEFEDEETLATVTVVEDFDPDTLIHGPPKAAADPQQYAPAEPAAPPKPKAGKPKIRERKVRYETKDARKREQVKQRKRRTEKAELAGGKASRRPSGGKGKRHGGPKR